MKNKKTIIVVTIFVVIALLHVLVAKLIFSGSSDSDKIENTGESGGTPPPVEPSPDKVSPKEPVPVIPKKITTKAAQKLKPAGLPLNYLNAVRGDIPDLPGSKEAKSGILVDMNTRQVIWCKNAGKGFPIASMTKMMTILLAMEDISAGKASLSTPVKVTVAAYKIGGTTVYLDPRETFTLGELMQSMMIRSANDSAYLVGEYFSDYNMPAFVARMNKRAAELKMKDTHYINPNGLPGKDRSEQCESSPEGLVFLAEQLLKYPEIMKWCSTRTATFRPKGHKAMQLMTNTNKLVGTCPGVDGMKTGFTNAAGSCITVTCLRGGKRMIAVVTGMKQWRTRNKFVKDLLDWGYKRDAKLSKLKH